VKAERALLELDLMLGYQTERVEAAKHRKDFKRDALVIGAVNVLAAACILMFLAFGL